VVVSGYALRRADAEDAALLRRLLCYALDFRLDAPEPLDAPLSDPQLAGYIDGWTRDGDLGVVAELHDGRPLGACWLRYRTANSPGFGFVRADVPEITLAVYPRARRCGVGRHLLRALIGDAEQSGIAALSLNVERANTVAARLYVSEGWAVACSDPTSDTMVRLEDAGRASGAWQSDDPGPDGGRDGV